MESKVRESFDRQKFMTTLGARLTVVESGLVKIECDWQEKLIQQNGFFHAGVITSIVDSACGYAAYSLMPEGSDVLSVEFKINMLNPAKCEKVIAVGRVIKSGRTLTICEGTAYDENEEKILAKMMATMICVNRKS